jgi:hypothetical protein
LSKFDFIGLVFFEGSAERCAVFAAVFFAPHFKTTGDGNIVVIFNRNDLFLHRMDEPDNVVILGLLRQVTLRLRLCEFLLHGDFLL